MRRYIAIGLVGLIAGLAVACGGPSPTAIPDPTPTYTPLPTPTPTSTPTPPLALSPTLMPVPTATTTLQPLPTRAVQATATPRPIGTVTRVHLPGMVLDQADVDAEFPGLPLDVEDSGYMDNEAAAEDTFDPNDTAADLTARGRLDGYEHSFLDLEALLADESAPGHPIFGAASVDLFDSQRSAQAFLQRYTEDFRLLQGIELSGSTLEEFQELGAPDVGTAAVAGRLTVSEEFYETKSYMTFVGWIRGHVRALLFVVALDDADLSAAVNRLALRIDQRIDGVLAGEISAAPVVQPPREPVNATPTPYRR